MNLKPPQITPQPNPSEIEKTDLIIPDEPAIEDAGVQEQTLSAEVTDELLELCGGDKKLATFFTYWLANGLNATKAYQQMNPDSPYRSAKTLGGRLLSRVDRKMLAYAYGVDHKKYFKQLNEALTATKYVDDGEAMIEVPDHQARRPYHAVLGQILDIESQGGRGVAVQVNVGKDIADWGAGAFKEVQQ